MYMYMYIYIERERARDKPYSDLCFRSFQASLGRKGLEAQEFALGELQPGSRIRLFLKGLL